MAEAATALPRRSFPLSVRLAVLYGFLVAATLLVVAGATVIVVRSHFERAIDAQLLAAVRSFERGPAAHARDRAELVRSTRVWLAEQPLEKGEMAAVRIGARVLTGPGDLDLFEVTHPRALLTTQQPRWWNLTSRDGGVRGLTVPLRAGGRQLGTLVLLAYEEKVHSALASVLSAIGWASAVGIGFAGLLGFVIVRRSLRPLARMTGQVEAVEATGDLSRRVGSGGANDEVGRLAAAFDRMLARLEQAFRTQRRFVADASHELRTPLTVARGQLELLADGLGDVDRRSLAVATGELDRMARIVDDLLLLARLDEGMPLERKRVEVELVMREALLRAMLLTPRNVTVQAEPGVYAIADPDRLLQALTNLLTNAVEHTDETASITLSSGQENGHVALRVADTGPGIPSHDLPHVFERLYRGSRARGSRRGAGLGLPIAASIVEAMGGGIGVRSRPGVGTTFTIRLPAAGGHANQNGAEVP